MTKQAAIDLIDSFGCIEPLNFKKACEGVTTQSVLDRRVKEFYNEQLKAEEIVPLVSVVKTTYGRMQERALKGKHVAGVDKDYFKLTEAMLNDELAVALNIPRDEIEGYIEKRLSE
jgi:CarD family transcriptional regulator